MSSHTLDQAMPVDSIVPSKDNARHIDQKSQSFLELVESIKAGGVQIPIHVWPHPKKKGKYEIRCGERRWRACKNLAHKTIPAIVHRGINIQTAMLLTITENKFREKLLPLEEVCEVSRCMDHLNNDAKLIADLIGQTEQWIRLRANIHRNLSQGWRKAFIAGPGRYTFFKKWSIGHLTLIARLPATSQKELLAEIERYYWQWENVSVQDLERRIGASLMLLNKAKWNLDDDTLLPKAGACSKCIKRSGAQPVLWFGATSDQISTKDRCLDLQCWKNKIQRYLQQRAKELSGKYSNLAYLSTQDLTGDVKAELSEQFGRVLDLHDVQKSGKGAKGSIPAMVVSGDGIGNVIFVRERQFTRPGGARRTAGKPTPLKQRREMLSAKRWSQVLIELSKKVDSAGLDDVVYKDKITGIMALAALFGNVACWMSETPSRGRVLNTTDKALQKQIDDLVKGAKGCDIAAGREKALGFLWTSVKPTLKNLLSYSGPASQTSGYCIISARWVAKLIQVDIDKLFVQVSAMKGFTEPKSWAVLNEDGSQKKAKAAKKAKPAKAAKKSKQIPASRTVKVDFRTNTRNKPRS